MQINSPPNSHGTVTGDNFRPRRKVLMKQFFRNIFYIDFPARGAFAGIVLFIFGTWSYFSLLTASGKIHGMIFYPLAGHLPLTLALLFALPALFLGYALFTVCRYLFKYGSFREIIRQPLALLGNKICLSLAIYGLYHNLEVVFLADILLSCHATGPFFQKFMLPESCRAAASYTGIFFLFLWLLSTAKLLSSAEKLPLRKMFGKTVCTVLLFSFLVLIFTNTLAHFSKKEFQHKKAELEKLFKTPVDAENFCKRYYGNRKPDPDFWKKADLLQKEQFNLDFLLSPDPLCVEMDEETAEKRQKKLFSDKYFKEWNVLLAAPLPLRERHIRKSNFLTNFQFGSQLRRVAVMQYWRLRFAVNARDTETIVDALEKMHYCRESLIDDMWQPAAISMIAVETFRLKALERVIAANLLSDGQLLRQKTQISRLRKHLPKIRENMLYAEAVLSLDWIGFSYEKIQKHRFLFPAAFYLWDKNKIHTAQFFINAYQNRTYKIPRDSTGILASAILPDFENFDIRLKMLQSLCLAMEKIIDLHLYKRKKGVYPDYPETLPIDPFTGQEMIYYQGTLRLPRIFVSQNQSHPSIKFVPTRVVAVLSCGKNKTDDTGTEYTDDIGIYIPLSDSRQKSPTE